MCQPDPITTNPFLGKCFPCHGLSWWLLLLYFPSQPRQTAVRPKLSAVSVIRETVFSSFSSTYVGLLNRLCFVVVVFLRSPSPSHHQVCSWGHDSHQLLLPLPLCVWERRPAWHCVLFCTRRPAGGHVGFFAGFIWLSTNQWWYDEMLGRENANNFSLWHLWVLNQLNIVESFVSKVVCGDDSAGTEGEYPPSSPFSKVDEKPSMVFFPPHQWWVITVTHPPSVSMSLSLSLLSRPSVWRQWNQWQNTSRWPLQTAVFSGSYVSSNI